MSKELHPICYEMGFMHPFSAVKISSLSPSVKQHRSRHLVRRRRHEMAIHVISHWVMDGCKKKGGERNGAGDSSGGNSRPSKHMFVQGGLSLDEKNGSGANSQTWSKIRMCTNARCKAGAKRLLGSKQGTQRCHVVMLDLAASQPAMVQIRATTNGWIPSDKLYPVTFNICLYRRNRL